MDELPVRVLLVEDDEDDFVMVRELLSEISPSRYHLQWVSKYEDALTEMERVGYDVYILDYNLGQHNGLELLRSAGRNGSSPPVIFLTGTGDYLVDLEAMKTGAADFLVKDEINAPLLDRSIRYAIEHKKSKDALRESERQLRYLSVRLLTVQEEERKRIAAELHDNLGQVLSAIKFGVENSLTMLKDGGNHLPVLESLVPTIQNAIEEVRRIYTYLRPSLLDDLGIVATMGWFCREFKKENPDIQVDLQLSLRESDVPRKLKVTIYRLMQEAMENVAKYSGAKNLRLSLTKREEGLDFTIEDDGCGFDPVNALSLKNPQRGVGLASMKERAEYSGGSLAIDSAIGRGTRVLASWSSATAAPA